MRGDEEKKVKTRDKRRERRREEGQRVTLNFGDVSKMRCDERESERERVTG